MQSSNMIFSVLLMLCTQVNMNNCYLITYFFFWHGWSKIFAICSLIKTFDWLLSRKRIATFNSLLLEFHS
jgi:hypothetical protein